MSSDSDPNTLPLGGDISDLPEEEEASKQSVDTVPVNLVSLVPLFKSIPLTGTKFVIGRNSSVCSVWTRITILLSYCHVRPHTSC